MEHCGFLDFTALDLVRNLMLNRMCGVKRRAPEKILHTCHQEKGNHLFWAMCRLIFVLKLVFLPLTLESALTKSWVCELAQEGGCFWRHSRFCDEMIYGRHPQKDHQRGLMNQCASFDPSQVHAEGCGFFVHGFKNSPSSPFSKGLLDLVDSCLAWWPLSS